MATQHPDNAGVPWWAAEAFISTQQELEELLILFRELPIDEYMWDWEGKYVDESVAEKLFSRAQEFFQKHPLGEDLHLTYRIPAFDGEKMHRMARAFMNILSFADTARDIGVQRPPVTEMFLPLTTSAEQPIQVRRTFRDVAGYHKAVFHADRADDLLLSLFEVTPLVEDTDSLFSIERIVEPYWKELLKEKSVSEHGQRVFLARSDPAMNAGLVPAVLAVKVALSTLAHLSESFGFPVHPVIGTGSLPFRGSVNPSYTDQFLEQYAGVRTYSIQSAFRYDYSKEYVAEALTRIKTVAPTLAATRFTDAERTALMTIGAVFTAFYRPTVEGLAPLINDLASFVPPRRERLQHIGLFGYSRGVGAVKLPRAISFTAAMYSIGVPPEIIGTGRGLRTLAKEGQLPTLLKAYPALKADLRQAGKYLNRETITLLAAQHPMGVALQEDLAGIEEVLQMELGPEKPRHLIHRNLTSSIYQRLGDAELRSEIRTELTEAARLRRSLG